MATAEKYGIAKMGYDNLINILGNKCMGAPVLATATTTDLIKTTNAVNFTIGGRIFTKAATDNIPWTTTQTYATQGASETRFYTISVDASGVIQIVQGDAGAGFPNRVADTALLGYLKVVTDSTHTFVPDTTLLGAAGITATFRDYAFPPAITSW